MGTVGRRVVGENMSYEYRFEEYMRTDKVVAQAWLDQQPDLLPNMEWDFRNHFIDRLAFKLHEEKNIAVLEGEVLFVQATTEAVDVANRRIHILLRYRVVTDQPLVEHSSPFVMSVWAMKIIKWAIEAVVLIIVAWIAIQAIKDCIKSMYVKVTTVERHLPDCTWEKTTIEEAPPWNILILVAGTITALIIGGLIYTGLRRK